MRLKDNMDFLSISWRLPVSVLIGYYGSSKGEESRDSVLTLTSVLSRVLLWKERQEASRGVKTTLV